MSSSNSFLYNNNAKFQKLKSSNYFSPYCHKIKNSQNNLSKNNKISKDKNFQKYKPRFKQYKYFKNNSSNKAKPRIFSEKFNLSFIRNFQQKTKNDK